MLRILFGNFAVGFALSHRHVPPVKISIRVKGRRSSKIGGIPSFSVSVRLSVKGWWFIRARALDRVEFHHAFSNGTGPIFFSLKFVQGRQRLYVARGCTSKVGTRSARKVRWFQIRHDRSPISPRINVCHHGRDRHVVVHFKRNQEPGEGRSNTHVASWSEVTGISLADIINKEQECKALTHTCDRCHANCPTPEFI